MSKIAQEKIDRKVALIQAGLTVAQLARRIRRPRTTVSRAIHGANFPRVLRAIERVLNP